ncbi:MAG TPA: DUF58 domain-containing protein [Chloroflexota bacterium]
MMDSPEARPLVSAPWLFGRRGLALLALVTAVAATYQVADLVYLAGALLLVGLVAHAWAGLVFARVAYSRKVARERAFQGDQVELEESLANPRLLPLAWLEVWQQLPAALQPEATDERSFSQPERVWVKRGLAVWPYQRLRWRRRLTCVRRGVFQFGQVILRSGDPFGFVERERIVVDRLEILVYPHVVPLRRLALSLHHPSLDALSASSAVADPTRTATIRDYRPDDPRRLIHWPSTARRGQLQVRVLEPATSLHVSLLLDVRGFSFGIYRDELFELLLSAVASISVFLQNQGAPIAMQANTNPPLVIPPGASVPHLQYVLESLARLGPSPGPSLLPWALADLPRGSTVILAASAVAADLAQSIAGLENAGFHVLPLLAAHADHPSRPRPGTISIALGCDLAARLEGSP